MKTKSVSPKAKNATAEKDEKLDKRTAKANEDVSKEYRPRHEDDTHKFTQKNKWRYR